MEYEYEDKINLEDVARIAKGGEFPKKKYVSDWIFMDSPIQKVKLPESYVELGNGAFSKSKIKVFEAEEGLEVVGNAAFSECYDLRSVRLPKTVKKIGYKAFYDCFSLTDLVIEGSLEECGEDILRRCSYLSNLTCHIDQKDKAKEWIRMCPELKKVKFIDDNGDVIGEYKIRKMDRM